mmetsp:Transcript_26137/g.65855  ORF Transcript_26137/g.65855 Transcript_26137/m.65855 type:complete len:255 (-) Transcript_26137:1133-1897(-)
MMPLLTSLRNDANWRRSKAASGCSSSAAADASCSAAAKSSFSFFSMALVMNVSETLLHTHFVPFFLRFAEAVPFASFFFSRTKPGSSSFVHHSILTSYSLSVSSCCRRSFFKAFSMGSQPTGFHVLRCSSRFAPSQSRKSLSTSFGPGTRLLLALAMATTSSSCRRDFTEPTDQPAFFPPPLMPRINPSSACSSSFLFAAEGANQTDLVGFFVTNPRTNVTQLGILFGHSCDLYTTIFTFTAAFIGTPPTSTTN